MKTYKTRGQKIDCNFQKIDCKIITITLNNINVAMLPFLYHLCTNYSEYAFIFRPFIADFNVSVCLIHPLLL